MVQNPNKKERKMKILVAQEVKLSKKGIRNSFDQMVIKSI